MPYYKPMTHDTSMFPVSSYFQEEMQEAIFFSAYEIAALSLFCRF